MKKSKIDGAGI